MLDFWSTNLIHADFDGASYPSRPSVSGAVREYAPGSESGRSAEEPGVAQLIYRDQRDVVVRDLPLAPVEGAVHSEVFASDVDGEADDGDDGGWDEDGRDDHPARREAALGALVAVQQVLDQRAVTLQPREDVCEDRRPLC